MRHTETRGTGRRGTRPSLDMVTWARLLYGLIGFATIGLMLVI